MGGCQELCGRDASLVCGEHHLPPQLPATQPHAQPAAGETAAGQGRPTTGAGGGAGEGGERKKKKEKKERLKKGEV